MKNVIKNIMIVLLIIIVLLVTFAPYVHAGILSDASSFLDKGSNGSTKSKISSTAKGLISNLTGILFALCVLIAIIATSVLGISFITASSSENRAEVKKKAMVVAIGVFVLFASTFIWKVVVDALSSAT